MNRQIGFTLVEISIVLVIIGLILGAIMYNSNVLIGNTKATSTVKLIQDLTGAVSDFKARYHYLPGDLPKAGDDISGVGTCDIATATANIGNGLIDTAQEVSCAPVELVSAGFIKGSTSGMVSPLNPGLAPDVFLIAKTSAAVTTFPTTVQNVIEIRNIPLDAAQTIDNKIDDGNFGSGNVMAASGVDATHVTLDVGL
ncbi:MAG: prepilin-type N-terminal cleavage/methylation domain-containing protein [Thiothrix sp.]|uniref:type II secretion system protein n=1 Tax=Thiothrix sp. TaxID=1032 RepID=UPI00261BE1C0|nr:prepilin-type N-terminal cleavage/methylation domain-containing protein [Thiothrix sp.]MDD5395589.1 prepilin-type N-terminal cleavage/methylation domain-containing protein [Thiothrix sp.]